MKNETVTIDKGIPIPPRGPKPGNGKHQTVLFKMKKGDSILVPAKVVPCMRQTAYKNGAVVCFRQMDNGQHRMWLLNNPK